MRTLLAFLAVVIAGCATVYTPPPGTASPPAHAESIAIASLLDGARADTAAGRLANAAASLERALRIEPRNPRLWQELARARRSRRPNGKDKTRRGRAASARRGLQRACLDLNVQYRTRIRKTPRTVPEGTFCRRSSVFAATDEMKPPLSFTRTRLNRTHKTTSMNASSIASQPNFVIFSIMAFAGTGAARCPPPAARSGRLRTRTASKTAR